MQLACKLRSETYGACLAGRKPIIGSKTLTSAHQAQHLVTATRRADEAEGKLEQLEHRSIQHLRLIASLMNQADADVLEQHSEQFPDGASSLGMSQGQVTASLPRVNSIS